MSDVLTDIRTPIGIALFGMDERSITRMRTIFSMVYKKRCEHVSGEHACMAIVDLDSGDNAWDSFRQQYPDLPAIVMSENSDRSKDNIFVSKPAKLHVLWESILNVATGIPCVSDLNKQADASNVVSLTENKSVVTKKSAEPKVGISSAASLMGSKIDSVSTDRKTVKSRGPKDASDVYFNPNDYVLGRIVDSIKDIACRECAIDVKCWRDRKLILVPSQNKAYTNLKDSQLKNMGVATFSDEYSVEINTIEKGGFEGELDGLDSIPLDYLVWDLAQRTARGRIPIGTQESSPLYLRSWPNFTRLPTTPHAMRIASLWVNSPRTLDDIAVNLDISREDVYSFYSAAAMLGLAGNASRQVDTLVAPEAVKKKEITRRGLLSSILRQISKKH